MEEFSSMIEVPAETEITPDGPPEAMPRLSPEESKVFEALGPYPVHIDDLARNLSMESGKLSSVLLQLELKNIVRQSPGKFFSIKHKT